jgi:hypothetical protein
MIIGAFGRSCWSAVALASLLLTGGCTAQTSPRFAGGWYQFQGTWIASGSKSTLRLGGDRKASIGSLTGSLVLSGPSRPEAGFRAEALVFNDTDKGLVGRAAWVDDRGDRVFSELRGQGTAAGNRIDGTFVGGTGRFAGATGTYSFTWRFLVDTEDGNVQGQSSGLTGRIHVEQSNATNDGGAEK